MKYHLTFLALLTLVFLVVLNSDLLYMVQSRSLFMSGSIFLADCLRVPGGFLTWLGLWFTQFCFYPALGGSLLVALWLALYVVLQRAFRPVGSWSWLLLIPVVALLVSTVDLGYWIYLLKQHGYWFRETLGTLFVALLLWLQGRENHLWRNVSASVLALASYPLLGWYAVLATLCILLRLLRQRSFTLLYPLSIFLFSLFLFPFLAHQYSAFRPEEAFYAGFPVIESNQDFSWPLTIPFVVVSLSLLLLCVLPLQKTLRLTEKRPWLIHTVAMVVLSLIVFERNVGDANYHAEMRMFRQVEDFQWQDVLSEIKQAGERGGATRQMALCKDVALINTQQIDRIFEFSTGETNRVMRDSCGAYMLYSSGPLLALHHGMANTATRWTIESSVEYGLSVSALKVLSLSALISGESQLADKYLSMLNLNLFQSSWVRRYRPLVVDPSQIDDYPELAAIRLLHSYSFNEVYGDHGHVEAEVYKPFSNYINPDMPAVQELGVYYAMLEKNPTRFWAQLQYFVELNPKKKVPAIFQEAAFLFQKLNPTSIQGVSFNFSKDVTDRFDFFNQYANTHARPDMSQQEIGEVLKPKYGHTYWWYYYFNHSTLY